MNPSTAPTFNFTFYKFIEENGKKRTEVVRDLSSADGMRCLAQDNKLIKELADQKVQLWANERGITANAQTPFPSPKHQGMVWIEYRFGGLTL